MEKKSISFKIYDWAECVNEWEFMGIRWEYLIVASREIYVLNHEDSYCFLDVR